MTEVRLWMIDGAWYDLVVENPRQFVHMLNENVKNGFMWQNFDWCWVQNQDRTQPTPLVLNLHHITRVSYEVS